MRRLHLAAGAAYGQGGIRHYLTRFAFQHTLRTLMQQYTAVISNDDAAPGLCVMQAFSGTQAGDLLCDGEMLPVAIEG